MKFRQAIFFVVAILFAMNAYSGDESQHKMTVKVVSADGDGESVVVIDSDEVDFDMHAMQVGENNSIVDKNGRNVLVTRTEDGYTFDVDGKTIDMPSFEEFSGDENCVHRDGARQVRVITKVHEVHKETE